MNTTGLKERVVSARAALRHAVEESKIDMGVADVPRGRSLHVLKSWDTLKSPPPAASQEPLTFSDLLRKTGT